jgi:NADH-quinone oxidoreductase subunit D
MPEVVVPIGPQHPALKEPVNFRVIADGEVIVRLELDIAYNHRGIEKAAESRDFVRVVPLLERICGICSHSHTTNFVKGIEEIMGVVVPPRGEYVRTIVAELERMHSHLLWLGVAAHEIGFNTLFMWTWRDREVVQDLLEEISGNRVNYGINEVGGVRRDIGEKTVRRALKQMDFLERRIQEYRTMVLEEPTIRLRFRDVARLTRDEALAYGTVGPTARASGVEYDIRKDDPYLAYADIPFDVVTDARGDVYGRTLVRVGELLESVRILRHAFANLPAGPIRVNAPRAAPRGEIVSRYEAPRGELSHHIRTNNTDRVERLDVRTPTLANWTSVAVSLVGENLADIPVVVAAIDPCLSCTSRIAIVDRERRTSSVLTWEELRDHGIRFYRGKEGR